MKIDESQITAIVITVGFTLAAIGLSYHVAREIVMDATVPLAFRAAIGATIVLLWVVIYVTWKSLLP